MNSQDLEKVFLDKTPLIDVRAPIEFNQGHLPGAINLPILNDQERETIGITYKKYGNEAAVKLGYQLVSGEVKEKRLKQWLTFIANNPNTMIYCFRGGQRSQITQKWIAEAGLERPLIYGGYKKVRNFLIREIEKSVVEKKYLIVSGTTGSGKTKLLRNVRNFYPTIDLEDLAQHRGSAFGALDSVQPSQINFENELAVNLLKHKSESKPLLIEDESHTVGRCIIPKIFFEKMRRSEVIWVEEPLEERIHNIFHDYVISPLNCKTADSAISVFERHKKSIMVISKKLGDLRTRELLKVINNAQVEFVTNGGLELNKLWIEKLLVYYYDPLYQASLRRRQINFLFKGTRGECEKYLQDRNL